MSEVYKEPHIVVAHAKNRVIGSDNALPWQGKLRQDLSNFKALTIGNVVLMGRSTYESIGKPLPGRENRVLSKDETYKADGCKVYTDYKQALVDEFDDTRSIFVIGGEQIYRLYLPLARFMTITEIDGSFEGDTFFPEYDSTEWSQIKQDDFLKDNSNHYDFSVKTLKKKPVFIDVTKARSPEQYEHYRSIEEANICPFCPEHLPNYHEGELIAETDQWVVLNNMIPYEHTQQHLVLIPKEHVTRPADLSREAWAELQNVVAEHSEEMASGGFAFRFGNVENTGASVTHLHAHLIQPKHNLATDQKVKFKISR